MISLSLTDRPQGRDRSRNSRPEQVLACDLIEVGLRIAVEKVALEICHPVGPERPEAPLPLDEVGVAMNSRCHGRACFAIRKGYFL